MHACCYIYSLLLRLVFTHGVLCCVTIANQVSLVLFVWLTPSTCKLVTVGHELACFIEIKIYIYIVDVGRYEACLQAHVPSEFLHIYALPCIFSTHVQLYM